MNVFVSVLMRKLSTAVNMKDHKNVYDDCTADRGGN